MISDWPECVVWGPQAKLLRHSHTSLRLRLNIQDAIVGITVSLFWPKSWMYVVQRGWALIAHLNHFNEKRPPMKERLKSQEGGRSLELRRPYERRCFWRRNAEYTLECVCSKNKQGKERKLPHVLQISITHMYVLVLNLVFSQAIESLVMYLTPLFSRVLFVLCDNLVILLHSKC